jgi:hypothetical protein
MYFVVFLCLAGGFELLFFRKQVLVWKRGLLSWMDAVRGSGGGRELLLLCFSAMCFAAMYFVGFLYHAGVCLYSSPDSGHSTTCGSFNVFCYKPVKKYRMLVNTPRLL